MSQLLNWGLWWWCWNWGCCIPNRWLPELRTAPQTRGHSWPRLLSWTPSSWQFDGTHIVSGSLDTSIRVWDVESGNCLHTLMGHQSLTSGMELRDNILVSGNADSTVKIWDIKTGQCLQTLQGEKGFLTLGRQWRIPSIRGLGSGNSLPGGMGGSRGGSLPLGVGGSELPAVAGQSGGCP